jgi:hypothetical protein
LQATNPQLDDDSKYKQPPQGLLDNLECKNHSLTTLDGRLKPLPCRHLGPGMPPATAASGLDPAAIVAAMMQLLVGIFSSFNQVCKPKTPSRPCTVPGSSANDFLCGHSGACTARAASPVPAIGKELLAFLADFAITKGIDSSAWEAPLTTLDYTPEVLALADVSANDLVLKLGIPHSTAIKIKMSAKSWSKRLEAKRSMA